MATTVTDPQILTLTRVVLSLLQEHKARSHGYQTTLQGSQTEAQLISALQALSTAMGGP